MMCVYKLALLLPFLTAVLSHKPHIALKFGDDLTSYIMINPDMSPVEEAVSVCSWIKQLSPTDRYGVWLHYNTVNQHDSINLSDNLAYALILGSHTTRGQEPVQSQWYHACLTWSYSSRTKVLYYNGVNIGTQSTPSGKKLSVTTGSITLGQYHNTWKMDVNFWTSGSFGGEMTKLNIMKRKLSDQEVAEMYKSGICSSYEDSLQEDIHLSWNTLLSDETKKHGNVVKFNLTCPDHTHEPTTAAPTTATPTEEPKPDNCSDRWAILRLSDFYNKEIVTELLQDLRDRWEILAEFTGHQIDDALISHLIKHHCDITIPADQSEGNETDDTDDADDTDDTDGCDDRWAILRLSDFYNMEVTKALIQDLRGRWELLSEFTGHVIDDALISHLIKHHCTTVV